MKKSVGLLWGFLLFCNSSLISLAAKAPELKVDFWVSLPEGVKEGPSLKDDWAGKVIYLYFFQSWCPGCHSSGFPTLQAMLEKFDEHEDVRFAAVQTVFEGFHANTPQAAFRIVEKYKLQSIPVGQSGSREKESQVMRDFRTRGTPWTVIIAPDGRVAYADFHIDPKDGAGLVTELLGEIE